MDRLMRALMYNRVLNPNPEIPTVVKECMEQGIDATMYDPKYETTPLFLALDELHEPEIIRLLIKNGYDMAQKTLYYDTVYDRENMTTITLNRYNSIENIILRNYYLTINSYELDDKLIEEYKKQPNYVPPCNTKASVIVYKKTGLEKKELSPDEILSDDDSTYAEGCEPPTEEEIQEFRTYYSKFIQTRVKQYCELFNINIEALIEKGEVYPDDFS
jgi:hypothetical protein